MAREKTLLIIVGAIIIGVALVVLTSNKINYSYITNDNISVVCERIDLTYLNTGNLSNINDGFYKYSVGAYDSPNLTLSGIVNQETMLDGNILQIATSSRGNRYYRYNNGSLPYSAWIN